jgi:hypothetical protein
VIFHEEADPSAALGMTTHERERTKEKARPLS